MDTAKVTKISRMFEGASRTPQAFLKVNYT